VQMVTDHNIVKNMEYLLSQTYWAS